MSNIFREEALPLISYDQDTEEYILNQEAVNIVRAMKGPIAVVGVVGLYRTGTFIILIIIIKLYLYDTKYINNIYNNTNTNIIILTIILLLILIIIIQI